MGQEDGIWASKLGFGPPSWDLGLKAGIWAEEEKIPHMLESIGHRSLGAAAPKGTNQSTNRSTKLGVVAKHATKNRVFNCRYIRTAALRLLTHFAHSFVGC